MSPIPKIQIRLITRNTLVPRNILRFPTPPPYPIRPEPVEVFWGCVKLRVVVDGKGGGFDVDACGYVCAGT